MTRPGRRSKRIRVYLYDGEIVKHESALRAVLSWFGIRAADVEDVTQETLISAWLRIEAGQFRVARGEDIPGALGLWLFGIALRQALRERARVRRRFEILTGEPEGVAGADPRGPRAETYVAAREALRVLQRLSPELAAVLGRAALGWTVAEIAAELGLPREIVATRLRMARRSIRQATVGSAGASEERPHTMGAA